MGRGAVHAARLCSRLSRPASSFGEAYACAKQAGLAADQIVTLIGSGSTTSEDNKGSERGLITKR